MKFKYENILHAYVFIGAQENEKRVAANEFAKEILCLKNHQDNCECKSCISYKNNNHPDFFLIQPEGNSIKIEQIRQMQSAVYEKPILSDRKVYIIDQSEKMTTEAANCLLKTLEEPPKYITIILLASNEHMLLPTVKSRCSIIKFNVGAGPVFARPSGYATHTRFNRKY